MSQYDDSQFEPVTDTSFTDEETSTLANPPERALAVPVTQQLVLLSAILIILLGGAVIPKFLIPATSPATTPPITTVEALQPTPTNNEPTAIAPDNDTDPFATVSITGDAAFVWDVQQQRVLYSKNPDEQLPLASLTKLMTALVAYELLEDADDVVIDDQSLQQYGNSGLYENERFSATDLRDMALISSSNDGAFALAQTAGALLSDNGAGAFVQAMNIRAEELGLTSTEFRNPTGLDISTSQSGGDGSARDMSFLMQHIITNYPEILTPTTQDAAAIYSHNGFRHDTHNTNPILESIPGLIGSKTGYTTLAGGNLTIAFSAGLDRPIIVTVLGSTFSERFTDVERLVNAALASVEPK